MKIAYINTYTGGGAGIACTRTAEAVRQAGQEVAMLVAENKSSNDWTHATLPHWQWRLNFMAERLQFVLHEADRSVRFAFSLANWGHQLANNPIVREADVLHLHWINQGFLSLHNLQQLAALQKPIVWTLHDMWAFTGGCHYAADCTHFQQECGNCWHVRKPHAGDLSHRIWKQKSELYPTLRERLRVVACSQWLADTARASSLLRDFSIQNIPNPINTTTFNFTPTEEARRQLGLPTDKKLLLFMAMNVNDTRKGFAYLQQSLQLLRDQHPEQTDLELLVIGKASPESLAALPYKAHYLGVLSDVKRIALAYAAADLFVMPSIEDNLPNTIMESLACGTPVLAFRTGGIPEMIQHQQTGYLAEYKNVIDFKNGILWFFAQPSQPLQNAARQYVLENYSYEKIAAKYVALYQSF